MPLYRTPGMAYMLAPVAPAETPGERLVSALEERGMSARQLSKALAAKVGTKPESFRRTISRWKSEELPIGERDAGLLAEILEKPDDYFNGMNFSKAISLAQDLVRQLDAGGRLPPETLLRVAEATERAGEAALLFADRLRREAEAHG